MVVHPCLRLHVEHYHISLTKVVEMMWMQKNFKFLYACGIPFNVLRSPYWHEMVQAINGAPKGYRSPEYDKSITLGLDRERAKIQGALGKFINDWNLLKYYVIAKNILIPFLWIKKKIKYIY
jgi:hypothetical protein